MKPDAIQLITLLDEYKMMLIDGIENGRYDDYNNNLQYMAETLVMLAEATKEGD